MAALGEGRTAPAALPEEILRRLRCPTCGHELRADADADDVAHAEGVRCRSGHRFARRHGVLDLSGGPTDEITGRSFASFGYEWNAFDGVREEDERFSEIYFRDLDLPGLRGKVGLDAGCGKGRFTRVLAEHLGAVAALDGSSAVEAAARNLAGHPNVAVVRADLRTAPFGAGSFDFISCLGVLHHLADPEAGFARLLTHLAPGGRVLVYLYSRPASLGARSVGLSLAGALRTVTVRLPHPVLRALCVPVAGLLDLTLVRPGAWADRRGVAALSGLPMRTYRDKPFRSLVLDTFDRLSAPVEHRYLWRDLEPWFDRAGLVVEAAREEAGWFVVARKP